MRRVDLMKTRGFLRKCGGVSVFSVASEFLFWLQRLMTVIET